MKLNNKGFALTSIIYMLIVLFLLLLLLLLGNLASRKVVLDKMKYDVKLRLNQGGIAVTSKTLHETLMTYYYSEYNPGKQGYQTTPGRQLANTNEGLIMGKDDSGTTYYFRGNVDNNYVFFAGKLFRIVRINGDGTIRIILNEGIGNTSFSTLENEEKYIGYSFDRNENETNNNIKEYLESWYNGTNEFLGMEEALIKYDNYIATTTYCNDTSTYTINNQQQNTIYYSSHNRLSPLNGFMENAYPLFNCSESLNNYGGRYNVKIGLITADEIAFAGGIYNNTTETANHYLKSSEDYLTMTPETFIQAPYVWSVKEGLLTKTKTTENLLIRPVINLEKNVIILSGIGTQTNPYIISSEK